MRTIVCRNCAQSHAAETCPKCGVKRPNNLLGYLLVVAGGLLALSLIRGLPSVPIASTDHVEPERFARPVGSPSTDPVSARADVERTPPPASPPPTLEEAISRIRPQMTDEENQVSPGAMLLASWGLERMRWSDLKKVPSTKYGLVMKNSTAVRGKLLCASGTLIQIEERAMGNGNISEGGLFDGAGQIYRFLNVGSTGELLANSRATICGVVIGKMSYANSAGGVAHSVQLVGMFDLPENRRPAKPASAL